MLPETAGFMKAFGPFFLVFPIAMVCMFFYPIFTIGHCVRSDRNSTSKTIWILLMIFIWPITSFFYGLFASRSRRSQVICSVFLLFSIGLAGFLITTYTHMGSKLDTLVDGEVDKSINKLRSLDTSGLSQGQKSIIIENLETLRKEVKFRESKFSMENVRDTHKASNLLQLYEIIAQDNKITLREYEMWISKYNIRKTIDYKELKRFVKSKKQFTTAASTQHKASNNEKRTYYENMKVKEIVQYKDGKPHGMAKKYYEDGTIAQEAVFKDGKLEGTGMIYYTDGSIEAEHKYEDGKKVGTREYNRDGSIAYEENF